MKKRITVRTLMIAVAAVAIGLMTNRVYHQYQADRAELDHLIDDHEFAVGMTRWAESDTQGEVERQEDLRTIRWLEAASSKETSSRARDDPASAAATRDLELTNKIRESTRILHDMERVELARAARDEAEARSKIERWKAAHWWFRWRDDGSP